MKLGELHLRFHDLVVERSGLAVTGDVLAVHEKLNVIRIVTGLIMLVRTSLIAGPAVYYFDNENGISTELALALAMVALLVLFTIGFFTPLATLALLLTYNAVDIGLLTAMLGTTMFTLLLWVFLTTGAGSTYSLDARLLRRNVPVLAPLLRRLYGFFKAPDARQLGVYLFVLFFAYGVTSVGAVYHHLFDDYWVEGHTMSVVLTNSYLSKWYPQFRALELSAPGALKALSVFLLAGQTLFQLCMLLLVFWRWGRHFVIVWGMLFFAGSIALLQLSILPVTQILLWAAVFLPWRRRGPGLAAGTHLGQKPQVVGVLLILATLAMSLYALQLPMFPHTKARHAYFSRLLYLSGLNFPVVFNESDLKLGDKWSVLTRIMRDGSEEWVPFNSVDGERGWYHYSDLVYFANSVRWRRHAIPHDPLEYNAPGADGYQLTARLIDFDARLHRDAVAYRVDIYQNRQSDIRVPAPQRYAARRVMSYTYRVDRSTDAASGASPYAP